MNHDQSKRGRGGLRRRWKWLGVGAAVAGALALGGCGHRGWHHGDRDGMGMSSPEEAGRRIDKTVTWVLGDVNATDAQKQQVGEIAKAAARDLLPLRDQHRAARQRALELMAQPVVDRNAIEALRAEELKLADTASRRMTQALADAMDALTPEQRAQLAERAKKRWG